jgi:hypothetical protein
MDSRWANFERTAADDPHALGEVLVRCADDHVFDTRIPSCGHCRRSERVVGLELHHRPHDYASRRENVFEQGELCQQVGLDAFAGFVVWPQSIAKRFDNVIGRDGDVRGAALHHAQNREENTSDRGDLPSIGIAGGRQRVVVPEQLVCAVD